ncbi:MAG: LysR family transcriptional regulator [Candidatus Fimivivens sp.]|nr:LysR family transcriptional regulator [Candidatus Fimivivens sp.]
MDTKHLKTFVMLAETQNYLRASERLRYAPSTLAKHIQLLETELNSKLFERDGNRISLTIDGHAYLPYAKALLRDYRALLDAVSPCNSMQGTVSVGGGETLLAGTLKPAMVGYAMQYPNVSLALHIICCARVPAWLRRGELDIGFHYLQKDEQMPGYITYPLLRDTVMLVGRADDPVMNNGLADYSCLHRKNFFLTYEDCCFTAEFRERMIEAGAEPGREKFFGAVSTNLDCIRSEGGYTLLPKTAADQMLRGSPELATAFLPGKPFYTWGQMLVNSCKYLTRPMQELLQVCEKQAGMLEPPEALPDVPREAIWI